MIARIFYEVNRSWSGKITVSELRRSKFLSTLKLLQDEDDINQVTDFFSYEHFYVIYCKFWELDKDHDLFIDREDLSRHNEHGESVCLSTRNNVWTETSDTSQSKYANHFSSEHSHDREDILRRGDTGQCSEGRPNVLHRVRLVPAG